MQIRVNKNLFWVVLLRKWMEVIEVVWWLCSLIKKRGFFFKCMFFHIVPTCICSCYCHIPTNVWSLHFLQSSHMYYDPRFACDLYVGYLVCLTIEMFDHFCSSMFFFLDLSYVDTKLWDFKGQCKLLFNKLWYLVGLSFFFFRFKFMVLVADLENEFG